MDLSKKGDIELGKIVTFIIVAVVLIVVVAFFLGGTTGITKAIKNVFFGVTAGTDITLATENCRQYCQLAQTLETPDLKRGSAYCIRYEHVDANQDGEADYKSGTEKDKVYDRYYCWPGADAAFAQRLDPTFKGDTKSLSVPCEITCSS